MFLTAEEIYNLRDTTVKQIGRKNYEPANIYYDNIDDLNMMNNADIKGSYNTYSAFTKRTEDATRELAQLTKAIDRAIKENEDKIRKLDNSVNGVKYSVELRNNITSLLNAKLSAIKAKVDFGEKADKAKKADYKLLIDLNGGKGTGIVGPQSSVGTSNGFLSNMINSGYKPSYQQPPTISSPTPVFINPTKVMDEVKEAYPEINNAPELNEPNEPVINNVETPVVENTVEEPVQPEVEPTSNIEPAMEYNATASTMLNANGEPITVYEGDSGIKDFENGGINTQLDNSMDVSYRMLKASLQDGLQIVFKYNESLGVGYPVYCNLDTKEEFPDLPTRPMDLVYPWQIDKVNNSVTTYLREEFPLILTDDAIPENILKEFEIVKNRVDLLNE